MDNLAIFSVPRSGSSWLGEIFNSSPHTIFRFQPNFAYSFSSTLKADSTEEAIEYFHKELVASKDPFVCDKLSISSKEKEGFPKNNPDKLVWKETHFVFLAETLLKNSDTKVIGLVRSPFATISSWLKIPKEFDPSWNISEQWRSADLKNEGKKSHYFGFEKWKEATQLFEQLKEDYPNRFYLVRYEDLLQNPIETVEALFKFAGLEMDEQTKNFLKASRNTSVEDAYGVYRKKTTDDKWKSELPKYIIEAIQEDLQGTGLEKYLE